MEQRDPQIVGVVRFRHPEREPWVISELGLINFVHVERWVRHHVIERTNTVERVLVIRVCLADLPTKSMHSQIHFGELHCLFDTFHPVHR